MRHQNYLKFFIDIVVIAFLILFPHYAYLPYYSYMVICFLVVVVYLKRHNTKLSDLGLKRNGFSIHAVVVGIVSAMIWMAFIKLIYFPFINHFFKDYIESYTEYDFIKNNIWTLLLIIIAAWIGGGFYEEIVFRGFIQKVIERWIKKQNYAFWIAGGITSVLFGLYHQQQGVFGVISATLGGLYWTFLFKRYKRNLWYPMVSHAVYDTIALTMLYLNLL